MDRPSAPFKRASGPVPKEFVIFRGKGKFLGRASVYNNSAVFKPTQMCQIDRADHFVRGTRVAMHVVNNVVLMPGDSLNFTIDRSA